MLPPVRYRQKPRVTKNQPRKLPAQMWVTVHSGKFNLLGLGSWYFHWRDPYYLLLTIPWVGFIALMAGCYIALNFYLHLPILPAEMVLQTRLPALLQMPFY